MLLAHSTSPPRPQLPTDIALPYADQLDYTTNSIHTTYPDELVQFPSLHSRNLDAITAAFLSQSAAGRDSPSSSDIWQSQEAQPMQTEQPSASNNWPFANGKLTPVSSSSSSTHSRQRESSLSSLGSAGPASPYNYNTSHPQVVLSPDSAGETYYEGLPVPDHQAAYYNFSKSPSHNMSQESYLPATFQQNYNFHSYSNPVNYNGMISMERQPMPREDEAMSAPDYGHSGRPSVASTRGSPATPIGDGFEELNRKADYHNSTTIPKLDRTMSDAYNDELYSPNFTFTSAPSSQDTKIPSPSRQSNIFTQRLQAANNQHLTASALSQLRNQSRQRSPFRQGSPLAPISHRQFNQSSPQVRLGTAAQMREQQKAENDARVLEEQMRRSSPELSTPKTISPKDALLDYNATEEDAAMPLFPHPPTQLSKQPMVHELQDLDDSSSQQSFASMLTSRRPSSSAYSNSSSQATPNNRSVFSFAPPPVPGSTHMPQYQFVSQQQQQQQRQQLQNSPDRAPPFPETQASVELSSNGYAPVGTELKKPAKSTADSGTYTCTYHGCTLRFETPAKLQKHKREGHRQSAPLGARRDSDSSGGGSGMTSAVLLRNSQAGPHKCERINPSTGKPCNAIFSRPYDLTRHEDTIHNARKQKVHCHLCTEEKTFSRNDALTRHMRVVHPNVDFPGKTRRRG